LQAVRRSPNNQPLEHAALQIDGWMDGGWVTNSIFCPTHKLQHVLEINACLLFVLFENFISKRTRGTLIFFNNRGNSLVLCCYYYFGFLLAVTVVGWWYSVIFLVPPPLFVVADCTIPLVTTFPHLFF
jgi:hypothetical protein